MKKLLSTFISMLLCFMMVPTIALAATITSNPVVSESGPTQNGPAFTLKKSTDYSEFDPGDIINYTVEVGIPSSVQPNPNTVFITDTLEDGATLVETSVNVSFKAYLGEPGISGMWPTELKPANISTTPNSFEVSFANKLDSPQTIKITYQVKINENFKGTTLTNTAHFSNTWFGSEATVSTTVNVIQPPEYIVTLPGTKTLNGEKSNLPVFDFIVEQSYGSLSIPAGDPFDRLENKQLIVHNAADGSISNFFEGIIWTNPGDYWYSIKEVQSEPETYTYDNTSYLVCVHVYNNMNPILEVYKGAYKTDVVKFENFVEYNPEPIPPVLVPIEVKGSITITKEVTTEFSELYNYWDKQNDDFLFKVIIGSKNETISLTAGESYTISDIPMNTDFEIKEILIPNGYTLIKSDNTTGTISWSNINVQITFVNEWSWVPQIGPFPDFIVDPEEKPDDKDKDDQTDQFENNSENNKTEDVDNKDPENDNSNNIEENKKPNNTQTNDTQLNTSTKNPNQANDNKNPNQSNDNKNTEQSNNKKTEQSDIEQTKNKESNKNQTTKDKSQNIELAKTGDNILIAPLIGWIAFLIFAVGMFIIIGRSNQ